MEQVEVKKDRGQYGLITDVASSDTNYLPDVTLEIYPEEKKGLKIEELFLELCQKCTNINCKNKLSLAFA